VEICLAAHFGRGGTTYAGLLARSGLLARLGSPARSGLLAHSGLLARLGSPARSGLLARSSLLSSGLLAGLSHWTWTGGGILGAQHPGLLAVSVGRLPSGAPSLTDAPVGRVLRCGCHTLQQIET
jgi:hypothetical protein